MWMTMVRDMKINEKTVDNILFGFVGLSVVAFICTLPDYLSKEVNLVWALAFIFAYVRMIAKDESNRNSRVERRGYDAGYDAGYKAGVAVTEKMMKDATEK